MTRPVKILVDEHSDGWDEKLQELGFEAQSVRKLNDSGKDLRTDFSVIRYAQEHGMILITKDKENVKACRENGIACISLDDEAVFKLAVAELERMRREC